MVQRHEGGDIAVGAVLEARKVVIRNIGLDRGQWGMRRRHKSFALHTHDLLCERVHGFGRRAEHLRVLILLLRFQIWAGQDRGILSSSTKDGRHRWHAVNLKCGGLSGIHSVASASSQEGVFLLQEQVVEAIVAGATTPHLVAVHSWRGVDTWHELGHLVVSTEGSELLLGSRRSGRRISASGRKLGAVHDLWLGGRGAQPSGGREAGIRLLLSLLLLLLLLRELSSCERRGRGGGLHE